MARGERQEDGNRGGVGTMTRLGSRQRPQQAQEGAWRHRTEPHGTGSNFEEPQIQGRGER